RKKAPCAIKTGHDLIGDELGPVRTRNLRHAAQPSRRLWNHPSCALNQRLNDARRNWVLLLSCGNKFRFNLARAFPFALALIPGLHPLGFGAVKAAAVAVRGWQRFGFE